MIRALATLAMAAGFLGAACLTGISASRAAEQASEAPEAMMNEQRYQRPDPALAAIVEAPRTPAVSISPDRSWLALLEREALPPISDLAERELGLAGIRIRPKTHGPSRAGNFIGLSFRRVVDAAAVPVKGLPEDARIQNVVWSPDGSKLAFTHTHESGIELWVTDRDRGLARRITEARLSLCARAAPVWFPDGKALLALLVPEGLGPEPAANALPAGPIIQTSLGRKAPARTFQDLLESPHDEALFDHYFTAQLARIDLDGKITRIGRPAVFGSFALSPDGKHILTEQIHRPYSYRVPASRFPLRIEVWDTRGAMMRQVAERPLQDQVPLAYGSVVTGPREVTWRSDAPATLCWAEALDGGDPDRDVEIRDALYLHAAPFSQPPLRWLEIPVRFADVTWSTGDLALVSGWWWKTRNQKLWRVRPDDPGREPHLLFDRSWEDRYGDPGSPVETKNEAGRIVLLRHPSTGEIYLRGEGASPEGNRPFIDAFDPASGATRRLFRSEPPYFEDPVTLLGETHELLLSRREAREEPPNYFRRSLAGGEPAPITRFEHPYPALRGVQKEIIQYERADGVKLSGTLFLPAGYTTEAGPLPVLMWAYPQEYKSADAAGQITDSPYRFDWGFWWSPYLWVLHGFAVLDDPRMPIIGEGEAEPNDTYVTQLVASAQAAIDELVRRGVGDRNRIAVGGISYGAFMAANLLAHSDLFAAGLAFTGAYNRTLTPFGFQSEVRTLWEAPEVYAAMSPFTHADGIKEPLLLIHGQADENPGTFPMQSERLFSALQGLGGTARLVMLPHETHSYRARESALHVLWEMQEWLRRYVKDRPVSEPAKTHAAP